MRILWVSNSPWTPTGYGVQTKLFLPRLQAAGHQMACLAFYGLEGGIINLGDIPIFPKRFHPYGQDVQAPLYDHFKADMVVTLIDAWVMEPEKYPPHQKWTPWFPVDHDPIPPPVLNKVKQAFAPINYSRYGQEKCREHGVESFYVPHGVDCGVMKPLDKIESRKRVGLPEAPFIVGMVAANKGIPSRKAFPQNLEAFKRFHDRHPDSLLYLHTEPAQHGELQGVNLPELVERLGIGNCTVFCNPFMNFLGLPDEHLAAVYNAIDVLLAVSLGEGFGVPILEAQACGTPVITGDWTSMGEVTFAGWKLGMNDCELYWTALGAYQFLPHIGAIEAALEQAWCDKEDADLWQHYGELARTSAMDYDADKVTHDYWLPVLKEIELKIQRANILQSKMQQAVQTPGGVA